MQILSLLFIVLSSFYFIVLILFWIGLRRLKIENSTEQPKISIVIAARNEAERIDGTLESLAKINYPNAKYEIIFVNDASTDTTAEKIDSYCRKFSNWHLINLSRAVNSRLKGKKNALNEGIKQSKYDLIFTTDADCIVPANWLTSMSAYFTPETDMVLGYSPLRPAKGFLKLTLKFDNLFSAIVAAAPAKLGFPHTSVGRNLAYRKETYMRLGGYDQLGGFKSGDDVHLTELFRKNSKGRIDYCVHPESHVRTLPPSTKREIFQQQIRKNSKTFKKSLPTIIFSTIVFVAYMLFLFLPLFVPSLFKTWLLIMSVKLLLEFVALCQAAFGFNKKELIPWFPVMQVFYPFYVIFFSFLGMFQIYEWKK